MQPILIKTSLNDDEIYDYIRSQLSQNDFTVGGTIDNTEFHNQKNSIRGTFSRQSKGGKSAYTLNTNSMIGDINCVIEHDGEKLVLSVTKKPFLISRGMIIKNLGGFLESDNVFQLIQ